MTSVGRFGFPKTSRIRQRREFQDILEHGTKAICPHMVLFARRRAESGCHLGPRLGLVVSRKVGESVTRSRVKRQLRESFRILRPDLNKIDELLDLDLVVVARASAARLESVQFASALSGCIQRMLRILNEKGRSSC